MIILPAIDLKNGECVRLLKGEFSTVHKVADDPVTTAINFQNGNAKYLHVVDLDGALTSKTRNKDIIVSLAKNTNLSIEVGGGIRDMNTASFYIENGIDRVIIGSAAVENKDFVRTAIREFSDKIVVGIDAKNGFVSTNGWTKNSNINYIDFAKEMEDLGVKTIIYTDISKDGTLNGPNLKELDAINKAVSCNIIASGGICNIDNVYSLNDINMYGAICGKSLYSGTLSLKEALRI